MKPLDDGLKQRLIGAIVLLSLTVIFLPVVFDREPIEPVDRSSQIPPPPEIFTVDIIEPENTEPVDMAPAPEQMYVPDESKPVSLNSEPAGLDDRGVPRSWVLQVASFHQAEHAENLRAKLVEKGFPAYVRKVQIQQQTSTRVLVGPKLDKGALIINKQEIDKLFHVNAILLEFQPK